MRLGPITISAAAMLLAAIACWFVATLASDVIEERSGHEVEMALLSAGHDWAEVHTDGLQVHIGGLAPSEARRFNALHTASTVVDSARVVDGTIVPPDAPLTPPRYSIEILRNDDGITLIGLVPASLDRAVMAADITTLAQGAEVIDLLESASYPEPDNWEAALDFGLTLLARLPRSKVSVSAGAVTATAIADSPREKADLEAALTRRVPSGVRLNLVINAPRPVIAPFTLRFVIDENGPTFDACSADTDRDRQRILAAAREVGMTGEAVCRLGLGVPSQEWSNAVIQGIRALSELGQGSITFSDADVSLVGSVGTSPVLFDRVVGELESNLPAVFSLHSTLPEPEPGEEAPSAPPEFTATRSPEGQLQLRGRVNNELVRTTVESFAKARFGVDAVYTAARIDDSLPSNWPTRVLAGLQALSELDHGAAIVQENLLQVRGASGNPEAEAEVAGILAQRLGDNQNLELDIRYDEALDPLAALPTPQECVDKANAVLASTKITFAPGSTEIEGEAIGVVDDIADVLRACRKVAMEVEIAGHTDSQGREQMNLDLSQQRADAVLDALMARRVLASKISARGYGESAPIADNDTEDGREANRRIEFLLLEDPDAPESDPTPEEVAADTEAQPAGEGDADGEGLDATTGAAGAPVKASETALETEAEPMETSQ
jgi:OOP family OmpA-OmpF porin